MKKRNLVIGLLVTLMVALSGATFAYWASGVTGNNATQAGSITIGEGDAVTTTVSFADDSVDEDLVPTAYVVSAGDDTSTVSFSVTWAGTGADGATGTIDATFSNYSLGTLTDPEILAMFTFTPDVAVAITANGAAVTFDVDVVFANEPATQAIYNQVANGTLTFDVTLTVTAD